MTAVLADQRRELILAEVERTGAIRISELTELLGVSDMTVRRDLEHLEARGWLRKVHGGAVLSQSSVEESSFEAKSALQQPAKRAIAARAAQLIEPLAGPAREAAMDLRLQFPRQREPQHSRADLRHSLAGDLTPLLAQLR